MILRAIIAVCILFAGYVAVFSLTARDLVGFRSSVSGAGSDPGFPEGCLPELGCRAQTDPFPEGLRVPATEPLVSCNLNVDEQGADPRSYALWRPRSLAEHEFCLSTIALLIGDWRLVAAWMKAMRFDDDDSLRLVPYIGGAGVVAGGDLTGIRLATGLPEIGRSPVSQSRNNHRGPILMRALVNPRGIVEEVTLLPARFR
ncbi:hypothetical protein [Jannaschia pohangensis]|uniref:Uncharacterized protein n=1 Tax=Jannaschia pohangensis TaxID=390807 RepID=A0A1I3NDA2_9RHOB|nr:hypothetical protein [Jannaschia pohangensis]SFJ07274.1 hypothetical protein SAMN04488095_2123 [Jannaschia pohangensis]